MAIVKIAMTPEEPPAPVKVILVDKAKKARLLKAADTIAKDFEWKDTVEGIEFWDSIFSRLRQIAENGELK